MIVILISYYTTTINLLVWIIMIMINLLWITIIMTKINLLCIITIMTRTYLLVSVNGKRCRTRVLVPSTI